MTTVVAPHPLIAMVQKAKKRRRTAGEVMRLSKRELVRYCDSLLTPEAAVEILADCFDPPWAGSGEGVR